MEWLGGIISRAPLLLGLAGGAAVIGGGLYAAQHIHADSSALASEVMGLIAKERAHRASLSKLANTAEAQADAAVAILLDDLSHALSQRIDSVATVEQLRAAAASAGTAGASSEAVADAQRQVRVQWGRLVQQAVVQVVAGTILAALAPASTRVLLAARAAEEATALSEAARAGPARSGHDRDLAAIRAWDDDRRSAVSHRALQLMHRWMVGEALGRAVDASSRAVTTAMLASDEWKGLLSGAAPEAGQEEAARSFLKLSDVARLVDSALEQLLGNGHSPAGSRVPVLDALLPTSSDAVSLFAAAAASSAADPSRRSSLLASMADTEDVDATTAGAVSAAGAPGGDAASAASGSAGPGKASGDDGSVRGCSEEEEAIARRLCLVAWDVVDSPMGCAALLPAIGGIKRRTRPVLRAAMDEAAAGSGARGASADPSGRAGIVARKLIARVDVLSARGSGRAADDDSAALLLALSRRVFAELSGASDAAHAREAGVSGAGAGAGAGAGPGSGSVASVQAATAKLVAGL